MMRRLKRRCEEMWQVAVDRHVCTGCGECVEVCPVEVFELNDDKSEPVNADECMGCESCVEVCEAGAITVEEI
jgi:NAD-dependent dihydropyrimidine dehydrogenase PreA subunit